ncbi:hypothetical protein [Kineococcus sp. SYSU DK001]|uniref:hypothetical protein n=1 Tax=Kineococcus sp. SYSU DK001 TaxID=3383122 RepID=UPI003D7C6621
MELDAFLAERDLPGEPEDDGVPGDVSTVTIAGRLLAARDEHLTLGLGGDRVEVPSGAVTDIAEDPSPPAIEPDSQYVVVRLPSDTVLTVRRRVSAAELAGAGLKPFVAAEPTQASRYAVVVPSVGPVHPVAGTPGAPVASEFAGTAAAQSSNTTYTTSSQCAVTCSQSCSRQTAEPDGGYRSDSITDTMTDYETDYRTDYRMEA